MDTNFKKLVRKRKITLTHLAKQFKISRGHLTNIANGKPAGKNLARKIWRWSCGQLDLNELLYPDYDSKSK